MSDVPCSLQSWASTIQSVVLTSDVFQFIITFLTSSVNCSCTAVPTLQRFTAVGTILYFFLRYYFHFVYSTVLLKLYYSVTRSILLITCRLCSTVAHTQCYTVRSAKKDTVCTVGFNCNALPHCYNGTSRNVSVLWCVVYAWCAVPSFSSTVLSMPSYIRSSTFSPRHGPLLTQAMCVCPIIVHCCALLYSVQVV